MEIRMEKLKKHVNTHLERMDKKTSVVSVTMSEIRSQIHRLENTVEGNFEHIPEPDSPSWVFPGDIVELHAPEEDIIFHDEGDSETPPNRQQQEESLTISGEIQEEHGNIPHGLSQDNISQQELKGMRLTHPHSPMKRRKLWRKGWLITLVTHHTGQPTQTS